MAMKIGENRVIGDTVAFLGKKSASSYSFHG
jgi:hypothetical protein